MPGPATPEAVFTVVVRRPDSTVQLGDGHGLGRKGNVLLTIPFVQVEKECGKRD